MLNDLKTPPFPGAIYSPFSTKDLSPILCFVAKEFVDSRQDHLAFRQMVTQFDSPDLARYVLKRTRNGDDPVAAFIAGRKKGYADTGRRVDMRGDARYILKEFGDMIRQTEEILWTWGKLLPGPVEKKIDFIQDASTVTYPIDMVKLMAGVFPKEMLFRQITVDHAIYLFTFTLQLFLNELACPQALVGAGQQQLHSLRLRRLFEVTDEVSIFMTYARDPRGRVAGIEQVTLSQVPKWVKVFPDSRSAARFISRHRSQEELFQHESICRVIIHEGCKFYLSLGRRNKRSASRQLKNQSKLAEERISNFDGEFFKDSVGSRYNLMAIRKCDGKLSVPTRKDVEWLMEVVEERLWSSELLELRETEFGPGETPGKFKSTVYFDGKILGHFRLDLSDRIDLIDMRETLPMVMVEELFMTGWDQLSSVISLEDDNHGIRFPLKLAHYFMSQLPEDLNKSVRKVLGWRLDRRTKVRKITDKGKQWIIRSVASRYED